MRAGLALAILIGTTLPAWPARASVIVIPGRPGVPIIINGVDASYAVVEGDGASTRACISSRPSMAAAMSMSSRSVGHYYPSAGHMPGYGRLEIEPPANRKLPQPAESYHQSWSAQSSPTQPPQPEVPFNPPPVIVAPQNGDMGSRRHRDQPQDPDLQGSQGLPTNRFHD